MRSSQAGEANKYVNKQLWNDVINANQVKIIGAVRRGTDSQPLPGKEKSHQEHSLSKGFTVKSQPDGEGQGEKHARLRKGTKEGTQINSSIQQIFTECPQRVPSTETESMGDRMAEGMPQQ